MSITDRPSSRPEDEDFIQTRSIEQVALAEGVSQRVNQLFTAWDDARTARKNVAELIEFTFGQQIAVTPGMPDERASHQKSKPRFAPNLLGAALEELSRLYAHDPVRQSESSEAWDALLWSWRDTLTGTLAYYDPMIRLCGSMLAVVMPGFEGPTSFLDAVAGQRQKCDGVDVWMLAPDRWTAIPHPADPRHVGAAIVHWSTTVRAVTVDNSGETVSRNVETFYYFDETYLATIEDRQIVHIEEHGLGEIPVVVAKNTLNPLEFFGRPFGGADLMRNAKSLNSLFEEIGHTSRLQRGQPVLAGDKQLVLGPDVAVNVEDVNQFTIVPNQANIAGMIQATEFLVALFAIGIGVPPATFRVESGTVRADNGVLERDRRTRTRLFRALELAIHRKAAAVAKTWNDVELAPVTIDYPLPPPTLTAGEALAKAAFEFENGIRDEHDTARLLNPHLREPELQDMVERGGEAWKTRSEMKVAIAGHAADLKGGTAAETETNDDRAQAQATGEDVQKLNLNGAQVTALSEVIQQVAAGAMPADAGVLIITNAFPTISEQDARRMVNSAAKHEATTPDEPEPVNAPPLP